MTGNATTTAQYIVLVDLLLSVVSYVSWAFLWPSDAHFEEVLQKLISSNRALIKKEAQFTS